MYQQQRAQFLRHLMALLMLKGSNNCGSDFVLCVVECNLTFETFFIFQFSCGLVAGQCLQRFVLQSDLHGCLQSSGKLLFPTLSGGFNTQESGQDYISIFLFVFFSFRCRQLFRAYRRRARGGKLRYSSDLRDRIFKCLKIFFTCWRSSRDHFWED